ncbi:MAG: Cna B-type domain-containing protein, partial [Acutalibacteraceae bacterium]|nr:Cna B-type domain-containing protein [Acutalibacteraceae bacterium]
EQIDFHKVWMDDGEEEYKKPVTIYMPARAMQLPFPDSGRNTAPSNWESMTDAELQAAMNQPPEENASQWLFQTLWSRDARYPDPLSGAGLGYHYLAAENGNTTVPNRYYGTSNLTTVSYKANISANGSTAPLGVKLQRKANGDSTYYDVVDPRLKANSDFAFKTYTAANGTITMQSGEVVDKKYSILLKDLDINKTDGGHTYPYTYTIEIPAGETWNVTTQETAHSNNDGKKDILVKASSTDSSLTQFEFTLKRSYTVGGTPYEEVVNNYTGERKIEAKAYAPTNNIYTIDSVDNCYSFVFGELEDGFDYQLVDVNNNVLTNTINNPQTTVTKGYSYVPYSTDTASLFKLPLSSNSYYAGMTGADAAKLTALNSLLTDANASNPQYLLNTNHSMTEENVWTARIQVRLGYSYHPRSGDNNYGYDLRDYAEHIQSEGQANNKYYLRTDLDGSNMSALQWMHAVQPESDAWINMLPAQYRDTEAKYQTYAVFEGLSGDGVGKEYRIIDDQNEPVSGAHIDIVADEGGKHHVIVSANKGKTLKFKLQQKTGNDYTDVSGFTAVKNRAGTALTANASGFYTLYANVVDMTTGADYSYVDGTKTVDPTKYQWLSGIYEAVYSNNYKRYYAVQEIPCATAIDGGRLSDVTFQNTRIGIVNYHIHFNWNVGTRLSEMKTVTLEIEADYHDGSDPHIVKFGEDEQITLELKDGVKDYYITNLPKYTQTGQVITYTVREVGINGTLFDKRGKCTLGNDDLYATIEEEDYILNNKSNSDDLMPLVITNSFSGTGDFTVNKIWLDDTNALNTRTDLYIQLWRHSTNTEHPVTKDEQIGKDYLWKKNASDSNNYWSFTYDKLAKYDGDGFRYEYYVKELTDNFEKNDYETYYNNSVHLTAQVGNETITSNDSVFTVAGNQIGENGVTVTVKDVTSKDHFPDDPSNNSYLFRVTDMNGTIMGQSGLTSAEMTALGYTTAIAIQPHADNQEVADLVITNSTAPAGQDFVFRLQQKLTNAQPQYEYNTAYLTAVSNAHPPITYRSSGGVFSVSKTAVSGTQNLTLTLSGLDKKDQNGNEYEYRVLRRKNGEFVSAEVSYATVADTADADNRVTVNVRPTGTARWLSFKLQRKLQNADDSTYQDVTGGQWELIDDMWRDVPDYYQFTG